MLFRSGSHSEIEVSNYPEWNADTILERGIKLLEFMEKRWNLKFEDETSMAELLFLDFMYEQEEVEETK